MTAQLRAPGGRHPMRSYTNAMETFAAAAQCHYQAGRFSQAVVEFEQCEDLWNRHCHKIVPLNLDDGQQQNDNNHQQDGEIILASDPIVPPSRRKISRSSRVEIIALPPLARLADLAMCRFRSAVASGVGELSSSTEEKSYKQKGSMAESSKSYAGHASSNENSTFNLLKEAHETNRKYRQGIKGAAMSLIRTCNNMELQSQRQPQIRQQTKNQQSIQRTMKSTSLAILMAGIAASHLHLYNTENSIQLNGTKDSAWNVLNEAAVLAADLMQIRREWMQKINGNDNTGSDLGTSGAKSTLLEESLCILNETLGNNRSNFNGSNVEFGIEDERSNIALHSFRSALKVAALSTGKLILPKLPHVTSKNELHENKQPSKRQKIKKNESILKEDAWNVNYLHSSPMLHSCDRLLDALSFHSAAIRHPQNKDLFTDKREVCFDEAVKWENRAGALYDDDQIDTDGCAGYALKIRNCLHGMNIASSSRDDSENDARRRTFRSLELLASSSSQFACDFLGCVHARRGEFSRAIEKFQSSMEHGEKNGTDADEEMGAGLAERRTITNMALCFLSMGDVGTPLELLLHLWMTLSEPRHSIPNNARPMALLLTSVASEMECMANPSMQLDCFTKMQLLWKLFHLSSLAQDWGTSLNAIEEMLDGNNSVQQHEMHCDVARAFALLQCRRPSAAREITRLLSSELASLTNVLTAQPLLILAELYNADALLLSEKSVGVVENECTPLICTQRALDALHSVSRTRKEKDNKTRNFSSLQELQVVVTSNHGIALLTAGDSVGALRCFREASNQTSSTETSTKKTPLWLLLPTSFNLSLLLLRDGHLEESAKVWLRACGHLSTWQKAVGGDNEALRKLKDLRVVAVNRHGLLMAKRSMKTGAMVLDQENIMEWVPPIVERDDVKEDSTHVGGVDASQITALDVVLLRHAVSLAEKKASSLFRKKANCLGY